MDLTTKYMGLTLRNPLIASASPLNRDVGNLRQLEDHGVGAVVLPSIFEEEIVAEQREFELRVEELPASGFAEAQSYFPTAAPRRGLGPARYLELVRRAKDAVEIPVIASLNGMTRAGWVEYARSLEEAGADAIELNIYFIPADLTNSGRDVELRYLEILTAVKAAVKLPVAMKLSPYFSAFGALARELVASGADALVLFNRFYQPDIDTATLRLSLDLELSTPLELRLPLLWIGILHGRVPASLAATTGVESANDVFKYLLAGADVVMTTSSLLRHGVGHTRALVDGLSALLAAREIPSVEQIRGRMSQAKVKNPILFERANYIRMLQEYEVR
jgi:dihydroorotate dehydrogenase (fumarate)